MITVHILSPHNETAVVVELAAELRKTLPDVEASRRDRIDLLVGVRVERNVDLLIVVDLEKPRVVVAGEPPICCGLIAVEIKQLCPQRFEVRGNQFFAIYEDVENRSVVDQANDAAYAVKQFGKSIDAGSLFVYAVAWLTAVADADLRGADESMVGRSGGCIGIFKAALRRGDVIARPDARGRSGVRLVRDRLIARRVLSPIDKRKADRVARNAMLDAVVGELADVVGKKFVRLAGHGGSGKTTALMLLASRLATGYGAKALILTFHTTLCTDIRSQLESSGTRTASDIPFVQSMSSFLIELLAAIGYVPKNDDGTTAYDRLDDAFAEAASLLGDALTASEREELGRLENGRFAWDVVLIDEAQDWSDAERDFLRAVYGHERLVVVDGLSQLVRRQVACDWLANVPKSERAVRYLDVSFRMCGNIAHFANAFADVIGLADWRVRPSPELTGGRIVIVTGELDARAPLAFAIGQANEAAHARPVDLLVCVPPTEVDRSGDVRRSFIGTELASFGLETWDASDVAVRSSPPPSVDSWRIVQYDSCRGLEGYATLLLALDDLYANKRKHPNHFAGDREIDAETVARRFLLIPITRAVQMLVIHIRDIESPVSTLLRDAAALMPSGVVEWCSVTGAPHRISPTTATP